MTQMLIEKQTVLYDDFLNELKTECDYHHTDGLVNHRFVMARMAWEVAEQLRSDFDVKDYFNVDIIVSYMFKDNSMTDSIRKLNSDELGDLAETLRVVAKHVQLKNNRSESSTEYVNKIMQNYKSFVRPLKK